MGVQIKTWEAEQKEHRLHSEIDDLRCPMVMTTTVSFIEARAMCVTQGKWWARKCHRTEDLS